MLKKLKAYIDKIKKSGEKPDNDELYEIFTNTTLKNETGISINTIFLQFGKSVTESFIDFLFNRDDIAGILKYSYMLDDEINEIILEKVKDYNIPIDLAYSMGLNFFYHALMFDNPKIYIDKKEIRKDLKKNIDYVIGNALNSDDIINKKQLDILLEAISEETDFFRNNSLSSILKSRTHLSTNNKILLNFLKEFINIIGFEEIKRIIVQYKDKFAKDVLEIVSIFNPEMYRLLVNSVEEKEGFDDLESAYQELEKTNNLEDVITIISKHYSQIQGEIPQRVLELLESTELYEWSEILLKQPDFINELDSITMLDYGYIDEYDALYSTFKNNPTFLEAFNNLKQSGMLKESILKRIVREAIETFFKIF